MQLHGRNYRITEYKKLFWLPLFVLFSILLFENIYALEPMFDKVMKPSTYLSWHTLFELISILISFCVFLLPYYSYNQNRRLRGLITAHVFLIMGCIDLFHTLSFKGMPVFLVPNDTANRATTFWIISRLVGVIGITVSSFVRINKRSLLNKNVFLLASIVFTLGVVYVVTYYPHLLPAMYVEGVGVTELKKVLEYVIISFLVLAGIRFLFQYIKYKENSSFIYVIAIAASIFSELAFVRYYSVYDINNYLGHIYKFVSYFLIFRVAFVNNIEKPYLALYEAKNKIKENARNLNKLVAERTKDLAEINQKLLEDLEYARDIQKAILPEKLPNSDQVDFLAQYFPAERVSGDFYNIFRLDDKHIGMYIGDVSGHGVPAAMLTVFLNQSIKTTKEVEGNRLEIINPSKVLENLYELYNKVHFKNETYILVLYAIYNTETNELMYSSAGMNAQPLIIKNTTEVQELEIRGLPICKLADICPADYTDRKIKLEKGDKVFFYTDGLVELSNKKTGRTFNLDSLKKLLAQYCKKDSLEIYNEINREIKCYSESDGLRDDVTFFMMRVS